MKEKTANFNLFTEILAVIVMVIILYLDNEYRFLFRLSIILNISLIGYILYDKFKYKHNHAQKQEPLSSNDLLGNKMDLLLEQIGSGSSNFK